MRINPKWRTAACLEKSKVVGFKLPLRIPLILVLLPFIQCTLDFPPPVVVAPIGLEYEYTPDNGEGIEEIRLTTFVNAKDSFGGQLSLNVWALPRDFGAPENCSGDEETAEEAAWTEIQSAVVQHIINPNAFEPFERVIDNRFNYLILESSDNDPTVPDAVTAITDESFATDVADPSAAQVEYIVLPGFIDGERNTDDAGTEFGCGCYFFGFTAFDGIERVESDLVELALVNMSTEKNELEEGSCP